MVSAVQTSYYTTDTDPYRVVRDTRAASHQRHPWLRQISGLEECTVKNRVLSYFLFGGGGDENRM